MSCCAVLSYTLSLYSSLQAEVWGSQQHKCLRGPLGAKSDFLTLTSQLLFSHLLMSRENSPFNSSGPVRQSHWDSESNPPLSLFYRWEKLRPRKKYKVLQVHSEGDRGLRQSKYMGSGLDAQVQISALLHVSCVAVGSLLNLHLPIGLLWRSVLATGQVVAVPNVDIPAK